jgi:hypothetical protein
MKKLLLALALLLTITPAVLAQTRTLIASESFTYSNGDLQTVSGGNWTGLLQSWCGAGCINVSSNKLLAGAPGIPGVGIKWSGSGSFTDNQYASAVLGGLPAFNGNDHYLGVACRMQGNEGTRDWYGASVSESAGSSPFTTRLFKIINGSETVIHEAAVAWANGDRLEIECSGTTIRVLRNSAALGGSFTATDTEIPSGVPGVYGKSGASMTFDDMQMGNLSGGGTPSIIRHRRIQ